MPKVTILVAAYNAAPFLPKCLDSLLAQTLEDIQVVCIDDGSTDDTLQVISAYHERDKRIELIHLEKNSGLSHARNLGLNRAKGEYVCMVDADDWLSGDAIERCVEVFSQHPKTDCVLFDCQLAYHDAGGLRYEPQPSKDFTVLNGEEACLLSLPWLIHGIYMVRSSIHQRYRYDETARLYSDENTTRLHFAVSREVRRCKGTYFYLQHSGSSTHVKTARTFDRLSAKESLLRTLLPLLSQKKAEAERIIINQLWAVLIDCYMFYHLHGGELSAADRHHALDEMHRVWQTIDRTLLDPAKTRKFGYRPLPCWWMFRVQEWLYFTLRGLLRRNSN